MTKKLKKLALYSLVTLCADQAYAHTGVRDQAEEGKASYNGFTITHGCSNSMEGGPVVESYPVLGQSAVFPMGDNVVWKKSDGTIIARGGDGGVLAAGSKLNLAVTGLEGSSSVFEVSQEIVDDLGNVHALHWADGAMQPKSTTITTFKVAAPIIANNCIKSLKVRIGVINWCDRRQNQASDATGPYNQPFDINKHKIYKLTGVSDNGSIQRNVAGAKYYVTMPKGNGDNNRADWWFGDLDGGSKLYSDPDMLQQPVAATAATATTAAVAASPAYWTTLTVNNSAADIAACADAGGATDVTVEPMGKDFDAYLTGSNTYPFTKGAGPF